MEFSYLKCFKDLLLSDIRLGRGRRKCCEIELHNSDCQYKSWYVCISVYVYKILQWTAVLVGCYWKGHSTSPLHPATYSCPFWGQWTEWFFSWEWIRSLTWPSRKWFICEVSLFHWRISFPSCQFTEPTHPVPTHLPIVLQKNVAGACSQDLDEWSWSNLQVAARVTWVWK